jgi:hypothetical protein
VGFFPLAISTVVCSIRPAASDPRSRASIPPVSSTAYESCLSPTWRNSLFAPERKWHPSPFFASISRARALRCTYTPITRRG